MSKILGNLAKTPGKDQVKDHEIWIEHLENRVEAFANKTPDHSNQFFSTQWYIYFHHYNRLLNPNVTLGRAKLLINEKGEVHLENVSDGSCDYHGTFELFSDYLMILDLNGDRKGYKLQMKVITGEKPKDISLGLSLSYEKRHVLSNMIVMQNMTGVQNIKTAILSSIDADAYSGEDHTFGNIPMSVRKFLSLKQLSVLKTPSEIYDLKMLDNFVQSYQNRKKASLYNFDKTNVFISSPIDSIEPDNQLKKGTHFRQMVDELNSSLENIGVSVNFEYPGKHNEKNVDNTFWYSNRAADNLKTLKYTKYFIMIYEKEVASRSLVELGYALAHCPCVLVLYNDNIETDRKDLTSRMNKFPKSLSSLTNKRAFQIFQMDSFHGSISKERNKITESIYSFIATNYNDI